MQSAIYCGRAALRRHRRQHGHIQHHRYYPAAAAAVSRSGPTGPFIRNRGGARPLSLRRSGFRRLEGAEQDFSRYGPVWLVRRYEPERRGAAKPCVWRPKPRRTSSPCSGCRPSSGAPDCRVKVSYLFQTQKWMPANLARANLRLISARLERTIRIPTTKVGNRLLTQPASLILKHTSASDCNTDNPFNLSGTD